jgi:hypothetical protein
MSYTSRSDPNSGGTERRIGSTSMQQDSLFGEVIEGSFEAVKSTSTQPSLEGVHYQLVREDKYLTRPDVTDSIDIQPFSETGTGSDTFVFHYCRTANSIAAFDGAIDHTADAYNQGEDISTIHSGGTAHTLVGEVSSEYHAYPRVNVPHCMPTVRGNDDDNTVTQHMQQQ